MAVGADTTRQLRFEATPVLVVLLLWEVLSRLALVHPQFFPPPTQILAVGVDLVLEEQFLDHVFATLRRLVVAFALGSSGGLVAGLLMGWSRDVRLLLNPYVGVLYPIPKIVLLPIMFSLFGVTEMARILTVSIAVFLLVAVNTMAGVQQIEEVHLEAAIDNGAGTLDLYRDVLVPGSLSQTFTGLTQGFGIGFVLVVVVEMVGADSGLGYVIWNSWQLFTISRMYVAILAINVLGIVFVHGTATLGDYLTPWDDHHS